MDELALLRDFRLEDASPDGAREHARAALGRAMTRRSRLPRRRYAVALAFALAAVLAAAAYAIVHQFVIGSAAPKDVQDQIGLRLAVVGAGSDLLARAGPYKLAGPARIVARPADPHGACLHAARAKIQGGGECQFVWYSGKRSRTAGRSRAAPAGSASAARTRSSDTATNSTGSPGHPYTLHRGICARCRSHADRQPLLQDAVRLVHRRYTRPRAAEGVRRARRNRGSSPAQSHRKRGELGAGESPSFRSSRPSPVMSSSRHAPVGSRQTSEWPPRAGHSGGSSRTSRCRSRSAPNNKGGRCIYVHIDSGAARRRARLRVPAVAARAQGNALPRSAGRRQKPRPGMGPRARRARREPVRTSRASRSASRMGAGAAAHSPRRRDLLCRGAQELRGGPSANGARGPRRERRVVARKRLPFAR